MISDRTGQVWYDTEGSSEPEQGRRSFRTLLLLDTGAPERRFPEGSVLKVEDGPWELMSSHTRLG